MGITARSLSNYQVEITAGSHRWVADEPPGIGDDAGPNPFDLLLGSLASCTIITLRMYARRKNWPLEQVDLAMAIQSEEVRSPEGNKSRRSIITSHLTFHGPLSTEQLKRLEEISERCPVSRTLLGELQINFSASADNFNADSVNAARPSEIP